MKRTMYTVIDGTSTLDVYGVVDGWRATRSKVAKLLVSSDGRAFLDGTEIGLSIDDTILLVELMQRVEGVLEEPASLPKLICERRTF